MKFIIIIILAVLILAALGAGASKHYNPAAPAVGTTQGG